MKREQPFLILSLFILAITFFSFYPTLQNGFVNWDDNVHLYENPQVRSLSLENIKNIFTSTVNKTYIPLTIFSYSLEYQVFKLQPFFYHFINLLLHLAVVILVFYLGWRLGFSVKVAGLAALIFAVHPMHVESVAWVTGRKDVLYSLFYLLAVLSYWQYLENSQKKYYLLSLIFGLLSILAKPMALSLPLILILLDWYKGRLKEAGLWLNKIPYFLYVIPITWMTYSLNARNPIEAPTTAVLTWIWTATFYLKKFFFPFGQTPLYILPEPITLSNAQYGLAVFLIIFCLWILWRFRAEKLVVFAFAFYFLSTFFLYRFDYRADESIVADRFMYLPSLGFCILAAYLYETWTKRMEGWVRIFPVAALVVVLSIFTVKTLQLNQIWKDSLIFWSYVLENNPKNATGYINRGDAYNKLGKYNFAIEDFNKALNLSPTNPILYNNLGMALGMKGDIQSAYANFKKALELNPKYPEALINLGEVYRLNKQFSEAIKMFNRAMAINPHLAVAYYNRSLCYSDQQDYQSAYSDLLRAGELGYPIDKEYRKKLEEKNYE